MDTHVMMMMWTDMAPKKNFNFKKIDVIASRSHHIANSYFLTFFFFAVQSLFNLC